MTEQNFNKAIEAMTTEIRGLRKEVSDEMKGLREDVSSEIKGLRQDVAKIIVEQAGMNRTVHGNGYGVVDQIAELKEHGKLETLNQLHRAELWQAQLDVIRERINNVNNRVWWILGTMTVGAGGYGIALWQVSANTGG